MSETKESAITASHKPRVASGYRLQYEEAQETWVLLYPEGMVKLNPSAAEILKRCDGESPVNDIIADLEQAFQTSGLSSDVHAFLQIAREQHWIKLD